MKKEQEDVKNIGAKHGINRCEDERRAHEKTSPFIAVSKVKDAKERSPKQSGKDAVRTGGSAYIASLRVCSCDCTHVVNSSNSARLQRVGDDSCSQCSGHVTHRRIALVEGIHAATVANEAFTRNEVESHCLHVGPHA